MTKSRFVALFLLVALALQGCTGEANDGVVKGPHALPTDLGADGKFGNYISSNAQEYELKGTAHVFSPTASQRRPPKSSLRSSTSWSSLFLHTPGHLAELAPSWVGPTDEASATSLDLTATLPACLEGPARRVPAAEVFETDRERSLGPTPCSRRALLRSTSSSTQPRLRTCTSTVPCAGSSHRVTRSREARSRTEPVLH